MKRSSRRRVIHSETRERCLAGNYEHSLFEMVVTLGILAYIQENGDTSN